MASPGGKNQRCIVIGAAGFLGRHTARAFHAAGYDVVGVGRGPWPGCEWGLRQFDDIQLPCEDLNDLFASVRPSVCVHACGFGELNPAHRRQTADERTELAALASVLEAFRRHTPRGRMVFISSAAVYGRSTSLPISEQALRSPTSAYGRHKLDAELLVERHARRHGGTISMARVFNVYGPGQRRQVLWDFCERALRAGGNTHEKAVRLVGSGESTRDFMHVEDVALAIRILAESSVPGLSACNVATGRATSIRQLAEHAAALWGPGLKVEFENQATVHSVLHMHADVSRLRSFGFEPRWSLAEGVRQYIDWFNSLEPAVLTT